MPNTLTKGLLKLAAKVKFKTAGSLSVYFSICVFFVCICTIKCNRPPRFLIDGQSEIVLRLKEGDETPIDSIIYTLRGVDPDGDKLQFGVKQQSGSDVIRVENISASEANVYLAQELDREIRDEYALVLTLTDGRLGLGNYVTQSLLILVEDVNDNVPVFKPYQSTISLSENAKPGVIATLQATDADDGAYGQVIYHLQELDGNMLPVFAISTSSGKGIVRLTGSLDYEKQTLHQLKVLAIDRAKHGKINTGTATILVKIEDIEDQPPDFVRVQPVARIAEDAPIGTSILKVTAVDGDRGVNNAIAYSLVSNGIGAEADLFGIERDTGVVLTTSSLDRESLTSSSGAYILQIVATEIGGLISPAPYAVTEVTVIITDVNDETPHFRNSRYECEIPENAPNNTPLIFLNNALPEVYDHDQGNNGTFQLYLSGANDIFEVTPFKIINEATFSIRVRNSSFLDYEQVTSINFTLIAREMVTDDPKQSEVLVIVHIRDRNDNTPEFTKSIYEVSVPENCEVGSTVAWVQALDDDSDNFGTRGVRYTNLAGSIENLLSLHPISGIITIKVASDPSWDREQVSKHYLTVEARDDLGRGNRHSVQLVVSIEDVNDNAPIFTQSRYEAQLLENSLDFETPLKIEARDADLNGTKNSEIEYELYGEFKNNFTIDSKNGRVRPTAPLDFEKLSGTLQGQSKSLFVIIRAKDLGSPSLYSDVNLTVHVLDLNDNRPVFAHDFYNVTISETTPGQTPILQVEANDLDGSAPNNRIVYRIQSGASDKFIIGADTGIISTAQGASLDPDLTQARQTHYCLNIIALDSAPGAAQQSALVTVNITIVDVNNKPPAFDDPGYFKINENIPVGTVVTRLIASDADSSALLRYKIDPLICEAKTEHGVVVPRIEFDCLSYFSLGSMDGMLVVAKPLDRELVEIVHLGVVVEDIASETGDQTAKAVVNIEIDDVNDNNPKFRKPYYRYQVTENSKNGVYVGNVVADDFDKNKTITYSLETSADIAELIHLDLNSGDIVVANKIDHEIYKWLNFTIKATDSGVPPRSSIVELYIQVLDENDNNPYFLTEPQSLLVPENVMIGETVAVVVAKDSDSGEFGKITYLLDRLSSQGKFALDPDSGVLKVSETLDRESKSAYLLIVEAWDNYQYGYNSGESRNVFKRINVTILDVNDNAPKLTLPQLCTSITEFHDIGNVITVIQASDADDPKTPNGQVMLEISDGNHLGLFALKQINEWTAELFTLHSLKGKHGNHTITIKAQDLGTPSYMIESPISICITDYNDHAPVFVTPSHNSTLRVPENATVGSALVQIVATDDDVGSNGLVRYRLKTDPGGHWKTFDLQPVSGVLELRLPLNRNKQKVYDIRIEAYDLGTPTPLSSDLDLTIYISNVNDYQPQFMEDEVVIEFYENKLPETEVKRLPETIDRDAFDFDEPMAPICYFIVGGNDDIIFKLHPLTHELSLNTELDREKHNSHVLLIKATDDCANLPSNQSFFDHYDDSLLKVIVKVLDENDNAPRFKRQVFTGGVSTATNFGTQFMEIQAEDIDHGTNAEVSYYLIGQIQMTLTEGLEQLQKPPFIVEQATGGVMLNFDPQKDMKGYFDFMVLVNDTGGLHDTARVFIYLLREDQRVRFVLRQHAPQVRNRIEAFREVLGNVTGAIVNVDEYRVHANNDGTVDKTRTDLYLHLVHSEDNSILEVDEVLKLVDQNIEKLDDLFKDFNVLDTQPGGTLALQSIPNTANNIFWLTAVSLFLLLLLLLCLALCMNQRFTYQRKLKAATATAYVGGGSDIDGRGLSGLAGRVPNTNKHSLQGSNPIWMQAYESEWFKNTDEASYQGSDRDSLDENVISSGETTQCEEVQNQNERVQNVYQTILPAPLPLRKLETTEL